MDFWNKKYKNKIFNINYEDLVSRPKDEVVRLLDYCGLEWENNCLDFSKNKTPIKTASVGQARNKIYSTSVKSSLKYELYLDKLFQLIKKKSPS